MLRALAVDTCRVSQDLPTITAKELESPLLVALVLLVELRHRICTANLVPLSSLIRTIMHHGLHYIHIGQLFVFYYATLIAI